MSKRYMIHNPDKRGDTRYVTADSAEEARELAGFASVDEGGGDELDITGTIDAVLAWVGDDQERAAEALAAEQDRPEGDQRSSLVDKLTAVIDG